ncbi:hypothetical protein P154DRAFT_571114 [Amniculicola lignicola CBS 123094]|uniref:Uncharacterized protein n=1 Tax=Amniculicola lignicola CBS 123094 TaxID=1392246 RepID=A0A6A5WYY9_9PLEO|nr:hypothetical protein P154DRAFT_571114 [Amniculicola lignicola CBS 123094]
MACGFNLKSNNYDSSGKLGNPLIYGFNIPDSCDRYEFGPLAKKATGGDYDTEHILEFQLLTDFFNDVNNKWAKNHFEHPDSAEVIENTNPPERKKIDFCKYWRESWDLKTEERFAIPGETDLKTPFQHLVSVYPSSEKHSDELVLLQRKVNAPAKASMWNDNEIYKEIKMKPLIEGSHEARRTGIQRLRAVMGVYYYMRDPTIALYFKREVNRIQERLNLIEAQMATHPRIVRERGGGIRTYDAYQAQGLGDLWKLYMNERFDLADKKGRGFVDTYLKKYENKYLTAQQVGNAISDPNDTPAQKAEKEAMQGLQRVIRLARQQYSNLGVWTAPWIDPTIGN